MGTRALPDMYALGPATLGLWAYVSGKALVPMLQTNIDVRMYYIVLSYFT